MSDFVPGLNRTTENLQAESRQGIARPTEWNGFKEGEECLYNGSPWRIRSFVTYPSLPGEVYVDFLPKENRWTGIEGSVDDLRKVPA